MDWIKCKVHHLLDINFSNAEIGSMYRLQAMTARNGRLPNEREIRSILTLKKYEILSEKVLNTSGICIESVLNKVLEDCEKIQNRTKKNRKYQEDSRLRRKSVSADIRNNNDNMSAQCQQTDKIRVDKSKEKKYIKKEKVKPPPKFVKPSLSEIKDYLQKYIAEKQLDIPVAVEAEKFESHYEASGWKVGNKAMVCWQAALRGWVLRNNNFSGNNGKKDKKYKSIREVYDEI